MAVASGTERTPTSPTQGPASGRALGRRAVRGAKAFLTLREGSIIVVTLVTFGYFAITTSHFVKGDTFKALLPYFSPAASIWIRASAAADSSTRIRRSARRPFASPSPPPTSVGGLAFR